MGCELGLPVRVDHRSLGVAWLKFRDRCAEQPAMRVAQGFAGQAGLVLDLVQHKLDRSKRDEELTRLQQILFPTKALEFPGLEGFVVYRPAGGGLGGDFYAAHRIDDGRTGFLIGDAEGSGPEAAMRMLPMITTYRQASTDTISAKHPLWKVAQVCEKLGLFGTALCFVIDLTRKKPFLAASRAGHDPIVIFKDDASNRDFPEGDRTMPLSVNLTVDEMGRDLAPGDVLVACTDGITEAGAGTGGEFGRPGIVRALAHNHGRDAETIANAIYDAAREHAGGQLLDDATVMVLRVLESG
jgi:sigma-B regulation protein RsbU (phosphoserine phosphatase)